MLIGVTNLAKSKCALLGHKAIGIAWLFSFWPMVCQKQRAGASSGVYLVCFGLVWFCFLKKVLQVKV